MSVTVETGHNLWCDIAPFLSLSTSFQRGPAAPGGRLEVAPITPGVRDIGAVAIGDRRTPRLRDIVNVRQHARTVQRQVDAIVRIPVVVDGKAVGPGELLEVVRRVPAVANPAFGGRLSFRLASESQRFFQQFEHCTVFGPV